MAKAYRRRRWAAAAILFFALLGLGRLVAMATGGTSQDSTPVTGSSSRPVPTDDQQAVLTPAPLERVAVGRGVRGATVVREEGLATGSVVVFLHGWQVADPGDYRAWISHLARAGNAVIMPRYQNASTPPGRVFANALSGIRSGLEIVGEPESLIVVGHSAGAALAADYAAGAAEARLPAPDAVLGIYPGRAILGYPDGIPDVDPSQIDSATRLIVMSSPTDVIVGEQPAEEMLAGAVGVPASRKRSISVVSPKAGDHYAPTRDSPASRRVFWKRLDRLIERVQRRDG